MNDEETNDEESATSEALNQAEREIRWWYPRKINQVLFSTNINKHYCYQAKSQVSQDGP